ncbi:MAG: ADP-ribosylglycohydrolase family protein [Fimbriimonadales bacterium]|nr:ADP-ribosylglycohydrolase family protein [Fimbriimonadales bacterium]
MAFRQDYEQRVYSGVLGKAIGVYLGRPFEGWHHRDIVAKLGEIRGYVHERLGQPLIVADDDLSGTFTFLRALEDHGFDPALDSERIGRTWLNYLIEGKTVLWWGGMGFSTEHTAYLRLKAGIPAPRSGSMQLNGRTVAEQIGAQIFIEGWGMVNPGDPQRAAAMAEQAARVSHDGEAVHAAKAIAAMVAAAFDAPPFHSLLEVGRTTLPADSLLRRVVDDVLDWRASLRDWREARQRLEERYGYERYGGGCHVVPNHGLVWLALAYGGGDFAESQCVVNTGGWDTDCNAANVGAILGVWGGLQGLEAGCDFRGPVADRMLLPTADPGGCVTDALREADRVVRIARLLHGETYLPPKGGARWHFSLPGSVQGFEPLPGTPCTGVRNHHGALAVEFRGEGEAAAVATTPVFPTAHQRSPAGYCVVGAPVVVPGQRLRGLVRAGELAECGAAEVRLVAIAADGRTLQGPSERLAEGETAELTLAVPAGTSMVVQAVGIEAAGPEGCRGCVLLDRLAIEGEPDVVYDPRSSGEPERAQWVTACDALLFGEVHTVLQNRGRGFAATGTCDWRSYGLAATARIRLCDGLGFALRWRGLRRHLLAWWQAGQASLRLRWDDEERILASEPLEWEIGQRMELSASVCNGRFVARWNDLELRAAFDDDRLPGGGIAMVAEGGSAEFGQIRVRPAQM